MPRDTLSIAALGSRCLPPAQHGLHYLKVAPVLTRQHPKSRTTVAVPQNWSPRSWERAWSSSAQLLQHLLGIHLSLPNLLTAVRLRNHPQSKGSSLVLWIQQPWRAMDSMQRKQSYLSALTCEARDGRRWGLLAKGIRTGSTQFQVSLPSYTNCYHSTAITVPLCMLSILKLCTKQ